MRIKRIELDGDAGHVAIERATKRDGRPAIRIDSIIRNPKDQMAWMPLEVATDESPEELRTVAQEIQKRTDGYVGDAARVDAYLAEIRRVIG
jgi:hypothetical protein